MIKKSRHGLGFGLNIMKKPFEYGQ